LPLLLLPVDEVEIPLTETMSEPPTCDPPKKSSVSRVRRTPSSTFIMADG